MRRSRLLIGTSVVLLGALSAFGDGAYFPRQLIGEAANLAQTRQEVLLVSHSSVALSGSDDCSSAVVACPGITYVGTTAGATSDGSSTCPLSPGSPDVWYQYTPATNGSAGFYLLGATCDTVLSVHKGCPGSASNQFLCHPHSSSSCGGGLSGVSTAVTGGTTYYVRIASRPGTSGDYAMRITGPAPPTGCDTRVASQYLTCVLRSGYVGQAGDFAWVVPVPDIPSNVAAHQSGSLFDQLSTLTKPRFVVNRSQTSSGGGGCIPSTACVAGGLAAGAGQTQSLVTVEATGQAGIFDWTALTSTGATGLLDWLNQNGFALPPQAATLLDGYIQQGMHFLAIRVSQPGQAGAASNGRTDIPPIQFTVRTSRRFYPLIISQLSAASETEILVYVLGDHRAEAANAPNGLINSSAMSYDASSPSSTNYESLFLSKIAALGGPALITEYAAAYPYVDYSSYEWFVQVQADSDLHWPEAPPAVWAASFLTRMRTVLSPDKMTADWEFQDAPSDEPLIPEYTVSIPDPQAAALLVGQPLAAMVLFGGLRAVVAGQNRRRRCRNSAMWGQV